MPSIESTSGVDLLAYGNADSASRFDWSVVFAYVFIVISSVACPRIACTALGFAPLSSATVQNVPRNEWMSTLPFR